ncbi:type III secretion system inner membrane ring subunit SctD [Mesorhizobium sp.]|uniref:type III secretion system inner membrane ring subunit SctD n=1 Tax=Mesorhizobium sp. TaxID=1871066 RepID=UPI000FE3D108|nr:type III secretion system inner membrane ring subunit SctD [Mesorhizobium sp.]RWN50186.1 MAG: EscD/YscD/HrpQ family type III secretion system inner membrane ring protein [Mesorhizobium sp.]RWN70079.1 MAG: EscD/YscD/HrpQ family type III secretion system inner membrane ring protein [Mesorhizobium sp.]RWN72064.1 MAG: EscD/YscD/HrpQ family type III secretion system inner membrane ring protein [Mesorhizobium sp.]RWN82222.1 MAG: EscD/YscD/HrpQ family type III secretion system inner membrane ring p
MTGTNMEHVSLARDDAKLSLRVLSGPNRGAETPLEEGVWLIGASDTDDLTFADPELAATHLRIKVEAGRIHIIAFAPGVRIGTKDLPVGNLTVLDPPTPVQVGRTIFVIGPAGSSFPEAASMGNGEPDTSAPLAPPELASTLVGRRIHLMAGSIPRRLRLGAVACTLLIMPVVVFWAAIGRVPPSASEVSPATDPMRIVRQIIRELNVARNVEIARVDDKLVIEGDFRPGDDAELQVALNNAGLEVEVISKPPTTLSDSQLIDLVTTVISGFGIEGSVRVIGAGEIAITGYGPSDAEVEAALHHLRQDIPGLTEVENAIVTPDGARVFLETAMTAQLRRSIHILKKADGVLVSGALAPIAFEAWQKVAARFREKFAPYIRLETQFTPVILPVPRGVHLGQTPFIVVENGTRLKIGDSLESLGQIVDIDRSGISVRIGADAMHLPYPSKPKWMVEEEKG